MTNSADSLKSKLLGKVLKLNIEEKEIVRIFDGCPNSRMVKLYSLDLSDSFTKEVLDFLDNCGLSYRLVLPGKGVTMEMNSFRTTICVDKTGLITQVGLN